MQVLLTLRRLAWITRQARLAITLDTLAHGATCTALQRRTANAVERFVRQNGFADARLAELYPVSACTCMCMRDVKEEHTLVLVPSAVLRAKA